MNDRITQKDLERLVDRINKATGSPMRPYDVRTGQWGNLIANIGNYHLDYAYGGVKLARICSEGGGTSDISTNGYGTKRQLHSWLTAFLVGVGRGE